MERYFVFTMLLLMLSIACATGFAGYFLYTRARDLEQHRRLLRRTGFAREERSPDTQSDRYSGVISLGMALAPKKPEELQRLRNRLTMAGFRQDLHLALYLLLKNAVGALAWGIGAVLWLFGHIELPLFLSVPFAIYYTPDWLLHVMRQRRLARIGEGLPEFIDMCYVCISAGMGWLAAVQRVAGEMAHVHPCISREFAFTVEQIKAGLSRAEALQQLAERNPTREMRHLVQVLIQNERQGSPVADSLNAFTARIYQEREQYMEEKAGKISAKMAVIIAPFMLLPFTLILVGEKIVNLMRTL
jgi:tight adherence protein C